MFEIWVYSEHGGLQAIFSVHKEDKIQEFAELYPHLIYFFAELSPV
jgi:hypothetical protein